MPTEQVSIYATGDPVSAEFVRQMLEENGIRALIMNKQDSFYRHGDIELYTHRDNVIRAKKLIQEYESR